ncbi:putative ubiquitin carboxyl-terminal hydrolase FAF [Schistosoma japonicum]|nr:putative ubiquitin carboxyl-terminal hydrolase FAF [Schistosoma japonicum]
MDMNNSRQDQFFNDSPIESSLNSIFGAITTENTSSTYLKLSPPPTTLFPVHAFNTLNSLLSRSHWQVPVLPDSQLETILLASINMAKHGFVIKFICEDIYSQDCLRFYSDGLINSFQKIFQDDAVTRWDSHILHFIYANALLAVELCSIKAKSDCLGILELESILFDPNSRFHTRSMISTGVTHEIRYGVHRNVVCRFDDIIKLLPHISISNEEKIECHHQQQEVEQSEKEEKTNLVQESDVLRLCDTASIREYSIPYDDYKDAPILVDFINLFGRSNGFERLKSRFIELDNTCTCNQKEQQNQQDGMQHQQSQETRDKADFISLNLIHTYLHPFALCSNYLSDSVIEDYFKPIISIVVNYLSHLTDDQIKLEAKKETRKDDFITGLYFSLCTLLKRIPLTKEDDVEKIELLCLNMIYRFFQSSSFNGKMNTLNELIRLLPNLNSLRVGQWITDIKLLKLLLRENLHQLQYVEKVEEIIRFMIRKLLLTSNDLDIIWESQIGKHETIIKNIFNMLTRLSLEFSMNQLNYLFNCFKRSWDKATKRQRERLIDLITMLAEQDSDGMMMQKTLDLLWGWAVSLKFSTDLMNASLKAHTKILSCNKSFVCQLRSTWLGKLASFLKIGPNEECLLPAAKQFIEIANIYNTGSLNENTLIQNINQQHNVLKATVDCIIQTMWSVHEERLNALMKMDSISKSSLPTKHTKVLNSNLQLIKVQELLKLLRYLIFQCRLSCTTDLLQQIWDSMLKATFKPDFIVNDQTMLSKCQHQIVLPNDCDLCFRWFTLFFNDPIWLEYRYFIWDNYSVLNPKLMTNAGIKFVIQLFHRINSDNTFIISEFNAPSTIKLLTATSSSLSFTLVNPTVPTTIPTVGINSSMSTVNIKLVNLKQLWNFILYSKKSVYNKTCKLLRHLYTNHISNVDLNRRKDFHIDIMNLCYAHIKAAYNELISSIKKQTSFEVTLPSKLSLSCNPEIESSVFKRILRILKLLKQFTTRLNIEMSVNDIDHCIPLKRSWIGSSFFLTVTCHTMPFLFHASSNDNNEDIVENNKQIDFLDDKTTTITLLVHGNVTLGELRAYLYDFCINGFTANTANVSVPTTMNNNNNTAVSNSNGNSSSTGNASDSSSSSGIHCQDSNNILHSMTNSLYQLELSIINKRQTNSVFLLSHNTDRELLVNLLIFLPNWTKKFLDNRDQVNNDAPFIHLELSAKLVYGYISNNYELSTSLTESSTTAPASSLLSRYCLKGFDATEVLTTQQRTNDITLDPLCVTARSNTSNDSNIEEKSDREMASELTIIDSIIDRNLEQEQLANNSNNNNKVGTLFIENKSNIDNSDPLGFTQQLDSDPNREFILNSDQRIEFLLNLSRIALTLNHPNVYHSVMDLLSCMPLHKKLTKFIEDSLIQLVVDKKTNGCDEPSTEHWSNSINITLLLLRGGALNLLLSSPYLISSFPLEPLYSPSLNSQNSNCDKNDEQPSESHNQLFSSSSSSTNATTTSLSLPCFVTPFTNNNNDNDNAQIIVYDITVHWKLLCQIRLWLLRIIHVLLLTTANALVLHKLNITPDEFKKSSFYKLLTTSLLLSVKNPNLLSDALQSSLLSLQLSSVTSTTKTMNVDDVEEDVGVDHTEQNIECICKLLLHTYKLATCSTHPVLGGNYFLLLNSVRVAQMTTEFNVPLNEIENCWLKCNYSTLTNLCLTGWQTRFGCENLMEYFKDFNMKHDRIMKLSSWCTEMNNTQENNLLKNKSPSENVLSSSEFVLAENKVKADTNDIIQPIDHSSPTFDNTLSSSTHLCSSDYVPSKISQSDEYFNLLVQLIPFMRCHEHFLQSTRHWLTEEVVWLRAMVINRHMGSYEASVSNSFIDDVLHCPTTPESVVQDSLVSSTKKEWITFATCRPDKIIHQFHDIPIEEKDLLICGHLRVWVALYKCFIDSSSSLLQLLTEDESKEINDLLKGCVDLNNNDDHHITCVDTNLRTDILEFILFPASKRYNEIRGSKVSSQITNQHHIMISNFENNNSSDSSSKNLTSPFSTSSNLSCSRNLMKCSFDFLLSLTIFNPLVNQLLTSMLYDLVFCGKFRAEAVHVRDQHDALEFFQILGNDLDEALDLCKLPKIVEVVLGGKFADQKICLDCPHRYTSYESFTTLNVDILDHRNLLDSLEQYVKGELLEGENAYNCRMCNKKIPILKRMCIQKLPLVLTIQLKRFDYDWEQGVSLKFNNYCEFPRHLDMFPYTAQGLKDSLDSSFNGIVDGINSNNNDVDSAVANDNDGTFVSTPDNQARTDEVKQVINIINSDEQIDDTNPCTKYNLRGVVVHSGQASSGHYYSFIRHYRPKTKTYKWYKYDDHNVIPVRLDKDKEAVDQWFGGEWKAPQHDMPKFSHLRSGKRWWSAYLLFYEREDFSEQIKKIPIPKLGSTSKQSRLTKRVQDIVDWQNIEHLHYRIQFNPLLPEFIYQLINKNVQLCMSDPTTYQNLAFITLELLLNFIFLRYRVVVSNWKCWLLLFIKLISISAQIRCELIKSMFLTSPDQIKFLLFDCPYPEIRFLSAAVIIYVSHLCMKDPSVQCDDILQSFILLVNNHTTSNVTGNNNDKSSDSICNTVTTSTNPTNTAIPFSNIENTTNNSTATSTTANVLSYLLKSTMNKTKSPVFVDISIKDNTQIASRIFSATSFINCFLKLPQKVSSCSLQSDSIVNCTLSNQLINPGECLIQLIIHQLHFSPNTLLSTSSSNKSFQQHHHQPYSTVRPGNPSSSFSMSSAAVTSTPQSMMTVPSSSSSTLYPSAAYNNRSTSLLSSSPSLSTMCPSSVIWAQYFAILLDYANCGEQECCCLLKLHVPEILLNYVLSYEPLLTNVGTSTATAPSIPYILSSSLTGCNEESRNPECISMYIERLYNELSMEIQTTGCPNLRLSSSLDALTYALLTTSTVSNSDFNFFTLYEYGFNGALNSEQNNLTTISNVDINTTLPSLIMYSGLKILLELLSHLIRSCEVPSHYLKFPSSTAFNCLFSSSSLYSSPTTSTADCYSSTKAVDQISCKINESEKRCESNTTYSVVSESLSTDAESKHFFSYENVNFSDLILRELICGILHPCDLDSILKLLERLLKISDSLKSVRIQLLFTYSNDAELFKLLNSNFIYETNAAAYQVSASALNSLKLDTSDNWLDDKEKTIGVLEQAERILFTLIPSVVTVPKNVIVDDSVQNENADNTEDLNIKNTYNIRKQVDNVTRKSGVKGEGDVDDDDNDNDDDDDDDDYYDDDDDELEQEEDEELDNGNDHLITSLCRITSSSLSTSDDPELDLPLNSEYMTINHNKNCLTRDSTHTIITANLIDNNNNIVGTNFNSTCITAGPPDTNTYTTITTASSSNSNYYCNDNYNNNSKQQILYGPLFSYGEFTENVVVQREEEEQDDPDNCNNHTTNNNDNK